jgi:hypothetical protein
MEWKEGDISSAPLLCTCAQKKTTTQGITLIPFRTGSGPNVFSLFREFL